MLHDSADDHAVAIGEGVNVNLGGFFEELIDEYGAGGTHACGLRNVFLYGVGVVSNDHGASPKNVAGANENGQANFGGEPRGFFWHESGRVARLGNFQFVEQAAETAAVFGEVNGFGCGADDGDAVALEFKSKIQRSLPA